MLIHKLGRWCTLILFSIFSGGTLASDGGNTKIAFLADIHLHDFYAAGKQMHHAGLPVNSDGQPLLMRSMQAQLNSTRLFNENYYVLRAALDDIVARGIKLVALPGDFTDDGQPVNVRAMADILNEYSEAHKIRFFAMNGNHDPTRPFSHAGGKADFLDSDGKEVGVYSQTHTACNMKKAWACFDGLSEWGYDDIVEAMSSHGFLAHDDDLYFETPFGTAEMEKRRWTWCDDNDTCLDMPDTSYLVEPVKDVWLLAIDANVYIPKNGYDSGEFNKSSNAGYNALLTYKPHLVEWITSVAKRANEKGKRLVAFSHFPMADFYDQTQAKIEEVFGEGAMQMARLPRETTTAALAKTGITLHMAGHMHIYDTNVSSTKEGLTNIQVPSLAAYQPGYSIVSLTKDNYAKVKTIILSDVNGFDELFPLYRREWTNRQQAGLPQWDKRILNSDNYLAFTDGHLKEVVRQRYLNREWPVDLANDIRTLTVGEFLLKAQVDISEGFTDDFLSLPAITLAFDFYRARNAGQFAHLSGRDRFYNIADQRTPPTAVTGVSTKFIRLLSDVVRKRDETEVKVPLFSTGN